VKMRNGLAAITVGFGLAASISAGHGAVLYDQGPINGGIDAWTINFNFAVTDSFTLSQASTVTGVRRPVVGVRKYSWPDRFGVVPDFGDGSRTFHVDDDADRLRGDWLRGTPARASVNECSRTRSAMLGAVVDSLQPRACRDYLGVASALAWAAAR
jgi:hypothetical protein